MRQLSDFEFDVLSRITDDVEAPHTISGDLARDLARPVSDADVLAVLLELTTAGLAFAYQYDATDQRFVEIDASRARSYEEPWFRSTSEIISKLTPPRA